MAQTGIGIAPPRYEFVLGPGTAANGQFTVFSRADGDHQITVAKVDWQLKPDGALYSLPAGTIPYSAAPWLDVAVDPFVLRGGDPVETRFTLRLPGGGALDGSYWTAVAFTTEPEAGKATGLAAQFRTRLLAIVYVTVQGTEQPAAELQGVTIVADGASGKRYLVADVVNTGNVYLRLNGELRFVDTAGEVALRVALPERVLLREGLVRYRLPLREDLPKGVILAQIEIQPQGPAGGYGGPPLYGEVPVE